MDVDVARPRDYRARPTGIMGIDEANTRSVLSRLMSLRVVGVFGLVLRFAFE